MINTREYRHGVDKPLEELKLQLNLKGRVKVKVGPLELYSNNF